MTYARIQRGEMAADVLQRDFTQIHNRLFRDPRLSFKAKGIFGLISTHRDGYGVSAEWIADASTDGVSAVKTGLRELERYGYLERRQEVRPDGTRGAMTYAITDMPSSEPPVENRPPAATSSDAETRRSEPLVENPPADEPPADDRTPKKISSKKTNRKNTTSPLPPGDQPAAPPVPRQGGGGGEASLEEQQAAAFVDALPYGGRLPGWKQRQTLIDRVAAAFAAGWTPATLHRQLTTGTAGAKSLAHVYVYRLESEELPDPAAAAADRPAEETPTPPAFRPEPPRPVVPASEGAAAVRAALRAQPTGHTRSGRLHHHATT